MFLTYTLYISNYLDKNKSKIKFKDGLKLYIYKLDKFAFINNCSRRCVELIRRKYFNIKNDLFQLCYYESKIYNLINCWLIKNFKTAQKS